MQNVCFFRPSPEKDELWRLAWSVWGVGGGGVEGDVGWFCEYTHLKSAAWSLRVWATSPWVCPSEGRLSEWPDEVPRAASSSQRSRSSGACPYEYPGSRCRRIPSLAPRIFPEFVYIGWSLSVAPPWSQNSGTLPDQELPVLFRETKQNTWRYVPSISEYSETNWKIRQISDPVQSLWKSKLRNVIAQLRTIF